MKRKLVLSVAMAAAGASLLVASALASPAGTDAVTAPTKKGATGGTLRINLADDTDYVDPALAYYQVSWEMEYATCMKLLNYSDKEAPVGSQLQPEAATAMPTVSADGKTYTFTIKPGIKSNKGAELTAANFAAAINRDLDPAMSSPASSFIGDVVGADAVLDKKAKTASGVKILGKYKLQIQLTQASPDFVARIAMPFFCAINPNLPHVPEGVNSLESWGPYYVDSRVPNRSIVLKKNPNYKGPRPHNVDAMVYTVGVDPNATKLQVEKGDVDYAGDGLEPSQWGDVGNKYGVNKGQFQVRPTLSFRYLALNTARPIFGAGQTKLRQAVNYAIDRPAILRTRGFLAGKRGTHYLPPGINGYVNKDIYPIKGSDYATAKKLASGLTKDGKAVLYTCDRAACINAAQIIQYNLKQIGLNVDVQKFSRAIQFGKEGTKGEPFDIGFEGWFADYADPFDFINILLDGDTIRESNNVNFSYFNDPVYKKKMQAAAKLSGAERFKTYGALDIEIASKASPLATWDYDNQRNFVSKRVKGYVFSPVYGTDLAAISVS